jgi:hypothetical protein
MAFFASIDPTNKRRFRLTEAGADPVILAIYDENKSGSYRLFAEIGADETGNVCFVSEPRPYWSDEIEEIR